jgi:hypothetical protein|nr:MAG TPA: hypothetical protein [Caudoviricetes sp.]
MRDTSKCKTMTAGEYMTPEQTADFKASWDECEYVLRDAVNAPEWAQFVDCEGTAYSVEALAEEWLQGGKGDDKLGAGELMLALSPVLTARAIAASIAERVEAGKLRAVVDSPDDWK